MQYTTNTTSSFTVLSYYISIIATALQSDVIEREKTVGFVTECGHTPLYGSSFFNVLFYIYGVFQEEY
jgi:hypothetical protein